MLDFFFTLCYNIYMRNRKLLIIFGILLSLTLLITICSAVFTIKTVNAYCYNADDKELLSKIEEEKADILGRSIFSINEDKLIKGIEERVGGIRVVNIERSFPDIVSINFIKLYAYFEVYYDGSYYTFANDGRIIEKTSQSGGEGVIRVKFVLSDPPEVGQSISENEQFKALSEMVYILEHLDFSNTDATVMITAVDFSYSDMAIYVPMRSGVVLKIRHEKGNYSDVGSKLHKALSLYMQDAEYRRNGTIEVGGSDKVTYSQKKDYIYEEN